MDMTIRSMPTEQTAEPTTTKEWAWDASNAWDDYGTDDERSDRVAWLVGDEVRQLYDEMRDLLDNAFDEYYPDQDDHELNWERRGKWLTEFENPTLNRLWDDEWGNPGVVRLVRDGKGYTLTASDAEGKHGSDRRTIHLDPALPDEKTREQVGEFLTEQDPLGKIESLCFSHVEELRAEAARASRTAGH
jgi:hypothetical protein